MTPNYKIKVNWLRFSNEIKCWNGNFKQQTIKSRDKFLFVQTIGEKLFSSYECSQSFTQVSNFLDRQFQYVPVCQTFEFSKIDSIL